MYKESESKTIAKKRYSFKKGYLQITIAEKKEFKKKLMKVLQISRPTYFSCLLTNGIANISKDKYDGVSALFNEYNIEDVWTIME